MLNKQYYRAFGPAEFKYRLWCKLYLLQPSISSDSSWNAGWIMQQDFSELSLLIVYWNFFFGWSVDVKSYRILKHWFVKQIDQCSIDWVLCPTGQKTFIGTSKFATVKIIKINTHEKFNLRCVKWLVIIQNILGFNPGNLSSKFQHTITDLQSQEDT